MLFSIDTHYPELFEKIRPGSKPEKVFENLPRAAALCGEHGLEVWANIVFMTHNGPTLDETIAYLADAGVQTMNVLQMIDVNGRSGHLDPTVHFSAEYVEWIKQKCIQAAKQKHVRLIWGVAGWERYDFRTEKIPSKPHRDWAARWDRRMKRYVPGYCMTVWNRLHVNTQGECTPCCYATGRRPRARRPRATRTSTRSGTAPTRSTCAARWRPGTTRRCAAPATSPTSRRRDVPALRRRRARGPRARKKASVDPCLVVSGPEHMIRTTDAPTIEIEDPGDAAVDS